jgi:hypothetical protein
MADDATAVGANPVVFFDLTLGGEPVSCFREQSSLLLCLPLHVSTNSCEQTEREMNHFLKHAMFHGYSRYISRVSFSSTMGSPAWSDCFSTVPA